MKPNKILTEIRQTRDDLARAITADAERQTLQNAVTATHPPAN